MVGCLIHRAFSLGAGLIRKVRNREAGVALIFALAAPFLVAITGLSVDVGYWYQNQTALQSAADAAALEAARVNAQSGYNVSTTNDAMPYAVAAANNASNNSFNLTSSSVTLGLTTPTTPTGTTVNSWTATATIPRPSFLSSVQGEGVAGLAAGLQSATAVADYKAVTTSTGGSCLVSLGSAGESTIGNLGTTGGTSTVNANGCNITADSNGCGGTASTSAISAVGGSTIETTNTTGASIFTAGCVYTDNNSTVSAAGGSTNIVTGASVMSDPLYYMGDAPTFWYDSSSNLSSIPPCLERTISGSGNGASVLIYPPTNADGEQLTYCLYDASLNGQNGYTIPPQGSVYFCQTSSCATDTGTALTNYGTNSDGASVSYFFNNGFSGGSQTNIYFGPGIYYFDGSSGLSAGGGGNINTVGTGSTFVFEGTTSYSLGGNSTALNLNAPSNTADCVAPAYYNAPADTQNNQTDTLYNMTTIENGLGICGVLIYEARNDTTGGTLNGGAASTINGIIYTPKASFTSTGGSSISSTQGGTLGILADNFKVSGGGTLNISIGTNSNDLAAMLIKTVTTTTSSVLLVQ